MIVVLEGLEGAGKTTIAEGITAHIRRLGKEVVTLYDPGSTTVGNALRLLCKDDTNNATPMTQMLMFSAARAQLLPVIRAAVAARKHVILDRWWPSTFAYQGAQGINYRMIEAVHDILMSGYSDLARHFSAESSFYLDVRPETGMERKRAAEEADGKPEPVHDRFQRKALDFLRDVRKGYFRLVPSTLTQVNVEDKDESVVLKVILDALHKPLVRT